VEQAYTTVDTPKQTLRPIYSDRDRQDFSIGPELPYYKLHGCITKLSSPDLPLILTSEDYENFRESRNRLFWRLSDDLYEHTFLFIGYSLSDRNFQSLFYEIQKQMGDIRDFPRCYAVSPGTPQPLADVWDSKKVIVLDLTAKDFFNQLEEKHAQLDKESSAPVPDVTEIIESSALKIDISTASELLKSLELIDDRSGYERSKHENYYRGDKPSWSIIKNNFDAERTYYEKIMDDIVLVDDSNKRELIEFVIITAEAGAGKSTLLMRLAYDQSRLFEGFCLFHKTFKQISFPAIEELYRVLKKRLYIYFDDAADNIATIQYVSSRAKVLSIPITFICAERKNEWNGVKDRMQQLNIVEYELPYLDDKEIDSILDVLERSDYLCALKGKTREEQKEIFVEKSEKQLLVAMREATEGADFETILKDEYEGIPSDLGKKTYLNICSLHRLGIPVRAGLLRRLTGVSFEDFKTKLLEPCERVIVTEYDDELDIFLFRSRHPHIAELVCKFNLIEPDDIFGTYIKILDKMDLGYNSDYYSFSELVRSNNIIDNFPNIEQRRYFYKKALLLSGGAGFVYQQFGIMELRFENLDEAEDLFKTALKIEENNQVFQHSYARLLKEKSKTARTEEQRNRYFKASQKLLISIMASRPNNPYAYDSYAHNLIDKASEVNETDKHEYLKDAHEIIVRGLHNCANKSHLKATEARLFSVLGEYEAAKRALFASHAANNANIRTTLLLSRLLSRSDENEKAFEVVKTTLRHNEIDEALNLTAAKLAKKVMPKESGVIIRYLKKAFDPKYIDSEANFLLAVEYFRAKIFQESNKIFRNFRARPLFKRNRDSYRIKEFEMDEAGKHIYFEGKINNLFGKKGFIDADLFPEDIFFHPRPDKKFKMKDRVKFGIGYNFFGPIARYVKLI